MSSDYMESCEIFSDRGPQFISQVWKHFLTALGAKLSLTSGYHPQSNEITEHMNQELEATCGCVISTKTSDWSQQIPWVEYTQNSQISCCSVLSPFEVSLGNQPPLFPADKKISDLDIEL